MAIQLTSLTQVYCSFNYLFLLLFFLRNEFDGSFTAQSLEYRYRPVSEKHVPGSDIKYIEILQPDFDVR